MKPPPLALGTDESTGRLVFGRKEDEELNRLYVELLKHQVALPGRRLSSRLAISWAADART